MWEYPYGAAGIFFHWMCLHAWDCERKSSNRELQEFWSECWFCWLNRLLDYFTFHIAASVLTGRKTQPNQSHPIHVYDCDCVRMHWDIIEMVKDRWRPSTDSSWIHRAKVLISQQCHDCLAGMTNVVHSKTHCLSELLWHTANTY